MKREDWMAWLEAETPHYECEDCWYSCATICCDEHRHSDKCDCGADFENEAKREILKALCGEALGEALDTVFCNMDANGDPVGAQPVTSWEEGYAAGLRHVYRVLKQRGFKLPVASPTAPLEQGDK